MAHLPKIILIKSSAIHTTSKEESKNIAEMVPIISNKIFCVPLGVNIQKKMMSCKNKKVLFLSRIHPIKGIELLLNAWAISEINDWELLVAGPGEKSYINQLKRLAIFLRINTKVNFIGPISSAHKQSFFSKGSIFVLPSFSENFGLTIAEAMASGLPVITTNKTPWSEIDKKRAGWIVSPDVNMLADVLYKASRLKLSELKVKGENGRKWMQKIFLWKKCALKINNIYTIISSKKVS